MKLEKINKDGTVKRKPTDNRVKESAGKVSFKGQSIEYNKTKKEWLLNGKPVGSISNLSQALRPIINDPQLDLTTYTIGEFLQGKGFIFSKSFTR